jgi:hypothetical protein
VVSIQEGTLYHDGAEGAEANQGTSPPAQGAPQPAPPAKK